MSKEKNTKKNTSKKTKVIKEQDVIKKSDYEDSNENKKILIVALVLALLIGGFAYIRSLSEKEEGNEIEEIIEKEDDEEEFEEIPVVEKNTSANNYQPVTTPAVVEKVDVWKNLENIPSIIEVGETLILPEVEVDDNGSSIKALKSYKYRGNELEEYVVVSDFDTTRLGEYVVTYTLSYTDGKVETKDVVINVIDSVEPIVNNVVSDGYYNSDILLDITEYSPYIVEVNGVVYDIVNPLTEDGNYILTITEDTPEARQSIINFTIDKKNPTIEGIIDNGYYNIPVIITVSDENIDVFSLTKDGEVIDFENGVTSIIEDGDYQITASDKAGNSVDYSFIIDTKSPIVTVTYTPEGLELTNESVLVTVSSDEELQGILGWVLSEDKLTLTKEFTENANEILEIKDLAGNIVTTDVVIDYIDYNVSYTPRLTLENLVANKVKATITSMEQLIFDDSWVEVVEGTVYKYEKIYSTSGIDVVTYEDLEGNVGTIEININITLDDLFVTYVQDEITQNVKAYVETSEEVLSIPEGWALDEEYLDEGYRYYKEYTENVDYEMVEFITNSKNYVATIVIDSIDRVSPEVEVDITYIENGEDGKTAVVITVSANEEIKEVEGWSSSTDNDSILKIVEKPASYPSEDQTESITVTDLKGNETTVDYTYNWN